MTGARRGCDVAAHNRTSTRVSGAAASTQREVSTTSARRSRARIPRRLNAACSSTCWARIGSEQADHHRDEFLDDPLGRLELDAVHHVVELVEVRAVRLPVARYRIEEHSHERSRARVNGARLEVRHASPSSPSYRCWRSFSLAIAALNSASSRSRLRALVSLMTKGRLLAEGGTAADRGQRSTCAMPRRLEGRGPGPRPGWLSRPER